MINRGVFLGASLAFFVTASVHAATTEVIEGDAFGGKIQSSATLDKTGKVETVTFTLSMDSIRGVSKLGQHGDEQSHLVVFLPLPEEVVKQTFMRTIGLYWNPQGHPPLNVYTKPHFDFHFYHATQSDIESLDCSKTGDVPKDFLPSDYVLDAPEFCVPQMGLHALPASDLEPGYDFGETFIYGYYEGKLSFLEPMITQEFLLDHKSVERELTMSPTFVAQAEGLLPHSYSALYNKDKDAYEMTFKDFGK